MKQTKALTKNNVKLLKGREGLEQFFGVRKCHGSIVIQFTR